MDSLYHICWLLLAQTQTAATEAAQPAADEAAKPGSESFFGSPMFWLVMLGVMLLYIMLMGKPDAKGAARTSDLLANLKKNDRVVTAGGILGTVVNYRSDAEFVTLRLDDSTNARMQVLASSIVRVVSDEDTKES